jgi:hypothetical protein
LQREAGTTIGLSTKATYDWEGDAWSIPVNLTVNQPPKIGQFPFQLGGSVRYWADSAQGGPASWGYRIPVPQERR